MCPEGHNMKCYYGKTIFWKCNCPKKYFIRSGSWLSGLHFNNMKVLKFIYQWSYENTTIKYCLKEFGMGKLTTISYNRHMREVCLFSIMNRPRQKIGGNGYIVEIDETLFTKRKSHAGRMLPEQWVFGGICRETKEAFVVKVPDRSAATLINYIREYIADGSIIYSDGWAGYSSRDLEDAGYQHLRVNHRYNFVNPLNGVHTQTIERMWGSLKWRNKRQRGTHRHHLDSYLVEFIWRKLVPNGSDAFHQIMRDIALFHPPQ